ncbi:hypothetical protein BOG92_011170 [Streptomyces sp. WAC00263]|nr:hypothetical protein BOG92_011170 [Streptomyces sp. WAC00263]
MRIPDETCDQLAVKLAVLLPHLDERQRRLLMAAEARALRHGGVRGVANASGSRTPGLSRPGSKPHHMIAAASRLTIQKAYWAAGFWTRASYATLPVDHFLIEQLQAHMRRFRAPRQTPHVIAPACGAREQHQPVREELIVTYHYGRPVRSRDFNRKWRQAILLADLPIRTRLHHLKRFYTSTLGIERIAQ